MPLICLGSIDGSIQMLDELTHCEWPAGGVLGLGLEEGAAHCIEVHAGGGRIALRALRLRQHLSTRLGSWYVIHGLQGRRPVLVVQGMRKANCVPTTFASSSRA